MKKKILKLMLVSWRNTSIMHFAFPCIAPSPPSKAEVFNFFFFLIMYLFWSVSEDQNHSRYGNGGNGSGMENQG